MSGTAFAFTGGGSGGTPPALQDYAEIMDIRTDEFNALALDALSRKPLNLGGRLFKPQKIDLESRSIQYQALAPNEPPLLIKETE
jgi:hypothetical protein